MFESIKKTVSHSFVYSLGNISSKLIGFVLLPLYTEYLSVEEYGILAILEITGQILAMMLSLNISTALLRWISDEKNEEKKKSIAFTALIATIILITCLLAFLIPFKETFSLYFFNSVEFQNYFLLLFLTSAFTIYNLIPLTILRYREQSKFFAIITSLRFGIALVFNYYFVAYQHLGVEGVLLGQLIGQVFLIIVLLPTLVRNVIPHFRFDILREMVSYSGPLIFSSMFALVLTMSDRFIIKYIAGNESVGIYSLGHKIASVINMLILQSFRLGFLPMAYKKIGSKEEKRFFPKILNYYTILLTFSALGLSLFGRERIELIAQNQEYWISYTVIPFVAFAFVIKGIQYNFSLSFHYSKKTKYHAYIVIVSASINILLNFYLVREYGFIGAGYAMLLSFLFMLLLSYKFGMKAYYIPYELKNVFKIVALGIILFFTSSFVNESSLIVRILFKTLLTISFGLGIFIFNILEPIEKQRLKEIVSKIFNKTI